MILNEEELHDCPNCGREESMMEVLFSDGYPDPHGEPGLLCYQCGNKIGIEDMDGGYDDRI
tara:strand:+ start:962 stop:1144 length:183 start_codon:yes stop_codon:yes gene_type:complete